MVDAGAIEAVGGELEERAVLEDAAGEDGELVFTPRDMLDDGGEGVEKACGDAMPVVSKKRGPVDADDAIFHRKVVAILPTAVCLLDQKACVAFILLRFRKAR